MKADKMTRTGRADVLEFPLQTKYDRTECDNCKIAIPTYDRYASDGKTTMCQDCFMLWAKRKIQERATLESRIKALEAAAKRVVDIWDSNGVGLLNAIRDLAEAIGENK